MKYKKWNEIDKHRLKQAVSNGRCWNDIHLNLFPHRTKKAVIMFYRYYLK